MTANAFDSNRLIERHREWTQLWHTGPTETLSAEPWCHIERNHRMNFDLWHEEDIARRDDLGAERVRQAKRTIDRCNQARNDAVERTDVWLLQSLGAGSQPLRGALHSETPGMMIDRLSIMALKLYHMQEEAARVTAPAEQRARCAAKAATIEEQMADLRHCLDELLRDIRAGVRRFKLYRQFKMYNDPSLNPELYKQK